MIVGIGIDLVELERIQTAVENGEQLAKRILTENEMALYQSFTLRQKVEFLGGRFAAKEAVSKAFGTGIRRELSFRQIEVLPNDWGAPQVQVTSPYIDVQGLHIFLSISHSRENAVAQVVLEQVAGK